MHTGTFLVGTIPHSWSPETVRRVGQLPQDLCTSLTRFHAQHHFLIFRKMEGDERGIWLYRGYLVGDVDGAIVGRWRETFSPPNLLGYEGPFVMNRRK